MMHVHKMWYRNNISMLAQIMNRFSRCPKLPFANKTKQSVKMCRNGLNLNLIIPWKICVLFFLFTTFTIITEAHTHYAS